MVLRWKSIVHWANWLVYILRLNIIYWNIYLQNWTDMIELNIRLEVNLNLSLKLWFGLWSLRGFKPRYRFHFLQGVNGESFLTFMNDTQIFLYTYKRMNLVYVWLFVKLDFWSCVSLWTEFWKNVRSELHKKYGNLYNLFYIHLSMKIYIQFFVDWR